MKQNINHKDIRAADDSEELIGILTAISVVFKRLARKLTAASYQSNYKDAWFLLSCPCSQGIDVHPWGVSPFLPVFSGHHIPKNRITYRDDFATEIPP